MITLALMMPLIIGAWRKQKQEYEMGILPIVSAICDVFVFKYLFNAIWGY